MIYKSIFRLVITVPIILLLVAQISLQSIPLSKVYHTEDGTHCTCGCRDLELEHEDEHESSDLICCWIGCLCDQDHETKTTFSSTQLQDLIASSKDYIQQNYWVNYFVTPQVTLHYFYLIKSIEHPPQTV